MERRRTSGPKSNLTHFTPSSPWPNLEGFILHGGSVSLGSVPPIKQCAAVASDAHNMLAALVRNEDESFMDLLQRFDAAIEKAVDRGEFTDEINV